MPPPSEPSRDRLAGCVRRALGREIARVETIAPGLGPRSFHRIHLTGEAAPRSVVARVSAPEDPALRPPGARPEPSLSPVLDFLARHGMPVPARHHPTGDPEVELLEDVGDRTLLDLPRGAREPAYREACAWIPRLQALAEERGVEAFERRLDPALLAYKRAQIEEWLVPWALGRPAGAAERDCLDAVFGEIEAAVATAPARLSHRDYKAANLHLRPGDGRVVWIDLQGAFLAPPEYDLVCLLRDVQVRLEPAEIDAHFERTCAALPDATDLAIHRRRFELLSVSRVGKDLSRYRYAAEVRGDPRPARYYPIAVHHLDRALAALAPEQPAFGSLREWVARLAGQVGA